MNDTKTLVQSMLNNPCDTDVLLKLKKLVIDSNYKFLNDYNNLIPKRILDKLTSLSIKDEFTLYSKYVRNSEDLKDIEKLFKIEDDIDSDLNYIIIQECSGLIKIEISGMFLGEEVYNICRNILDVVDLERKYNDENYDITLIYDKEILYDIAVRCENSLLNTKIIMIKEYLNYINLCFSFKVYLDE